MNKTDRLRVLSVRADEMGAEVQAPVVSAFGASDRPRIWLDVCERTDIAARLRMVADLLTHSGEAELPEALDLARRTLSRELERLS